MTLREQIFTWLACLIVAALFFLLAIIVGFGIRSRLRARGSGARLRAPEIAELESQWQVRLPRSLESLYHSGVVHRSEFYLAPPGSDREEDWWYVASFIPLTRNDVANWIAASNVAGIPIADDGSKGIYYLPFEQLRRGDPPAVLLRPAGWKATDVTVAASVDEFVKFEARAVPHTN